MRWIVFVVQETRQPENPIAVSASGISAEGNGEKFEQAFLLGKPEVIDLPQDLVFARRCGQDRGRIRDRAGGPNCGQSDLAIRIDIYI